MLPLLAACTRVVTPEVAEPPVSYPALPSWFRHDPVGADWDGRHDLLLLPAQGEPIEVPRQWQRPVPGDRPYPLRRPLENVPTVLIDAARPWGEVCRHLRPWRARGEHTLVPPPHLTVSSPPKPPEPGEDDLLWPPPPPPPPPPLATRYPCEPLLVARGPVRPSVPEHFPEYPVMKRPLDRLCTGAGPEEVLFEASIAGDTLTLSTSGGSFTDLAELARRLRPAPIKSVRITAIDPNTSWAWVQRAVDDIREAGADGVWLPLDCGASEPIVSPG